MPKLWTQLAIGRAAVAALATLAATSIAVANEIATAQGAITIQEASEGLRSPTCAELVVEARDALDDHLIGTTHPHLAADGTCRYAISVPAQSAVWLHTRAALVAGARSDAAGGAAAMNGAPAAAHAGIPSGRQVQGRGVQIRFTVISPSTYFFAPGEQKTVPLTY